MREQNASTIDTVSDVSRLMLDGRSLVANAKAIVVRQGIIIDDAHQYRRGSIEPICGVTNTLSRVGIIDDDRWSQEHADRGAQIHRVARLDIQERQDSYFWPVSIHNYGASLRAWVDKHHLTTIDTELLVYHQTHDYAGTLDWFGVLDGALTVLDWKSGAEAAWHRLQTAAYVEALRQYLVFVRSDVGVTTVKPHMKRGAVYLHDDGSPATFRAHYDPRDRAIFHAALVVARFR